MDSKSIPVLGCRFDSGHGYEYGPGRFPGTEKHNFMTIYEFQATTPYSGLRVSVHNRYTKKSAYKILAEKAMAIYKEKVESDPVHLREYELRLCVFEYRTDKDGIFRLVSRTFRDFLLKDGVVTMINETTLTK